MSSKLKLDWCSYAAAKYAVERWHYSQTMPSPPRVQIGVWEDDSFIGCVLFSRGASAPYRGHVGVIYQAGNWLYTGQTGASRCFQAPDGKLHHERTISESGYKKQFGIRKRVFKASECRLVRMPPKHRYLMPLDAETRDRLLPLAKSYPKTTPVSFSCAASDTIDTSGHQSEKGGAAPTAALQLPA